MKEQYQHAIDRVEKHAKPLQSEMGIDWVDINHRYLDGLKDNDASIVAEADPIWEYRTATVKWYLPALVRLDEKEVEHTIAHEYIHVMMAPIESKIPDKHAELKEFVVEGLAKAIISLRHGSIS